MERWRGLLRVPLHADSRDFYQVAASLCLSLSSNSLTVPSINAIFFTGDRVMGTGNPLIERLSNLQNIADIMVSKIGGSVNAWVIEASLFNGPFAVYKDFIPSVNQWGEPKSYDPTGFPASWSTVSLLSNCLRESAATHKQNIPSLASISGLQFYRPKTLVFGFSKGGTVVNQLVAELGLAKSRSMQDSTQTEDELQQIIPCSKEDFLDSIAEIHYVDVGLNSVGAYITDSHLVEKISEHLEQAEGDKGLRFVLHGTPRQWCDTNRSWIRNEKEKLFHLLKSVTQRSGGKLQVCERFYLADRRPDLQMHFEIIEKLDIS
ncbi:uncharacterized protein LOC115699422 [Cannabis sativa]|uniref:Uncharacterized protein n=1 Tax=Cannabis sativa TaxID=3483 RepID=A0A7J6HQ92_CANSA|nr:uncharacterized protein LOC115699422 [Cannabis sativa]XP_060958463.1 uncharacterized protein LOC115699422 [Cannabis sativa]XP_060958464.1 uncharacterized protein LOC115699422 [Cannabis sativa]XP_060958465.1 uncharacterized protein LOC115699422 [Cannabis sativa]KAF4396889.1 hypothetical protein F8388_004857 [Cannabis sativa]